MASNASAVYGKQYIRFAETFYAGVNKQDGTSIGTVEVGEFRVVCQWVEYDGVPTISQPGDRDTSKANTRFVGVNQAYIPTAIAEPQADRSATVATSGLLLVEMDPAATLDVALIGAQLEVDTSGRAVNSGGGDAVSVNGAEVYIRETLDIGGRKMVLCVFG